jgi:hypothetical protein
MSNLNLLFYSILTTKMKYVSVFVYFIRRENEEKRSYSYNKDFTKSASIILVDLILMKIKTCLREKKGKLD